MHTHTYPHTQNFKSTASLQCNCNCLGEKVNMPFVLLLGIESNEKYTKNVPYLMFLTTYLCSSLGLVTYVFCVYQKSKNFMLKSKVFHFCSVMQHSRVLLSLSLFLQSTKKHHTFLSLFWFHASCIILILF